MRDLLTQAEATLAQAGVASPAYDARALAAHILKCQPLDLGFLSSVPEDFAQDFSLLVARRALREPLQYIIGTAAFGSLDLAVGPGVFIPRPETEAMAQWAVEHAQEMLKERKAPRIADLCTGSGAIAGYIATSLGRHAQVFAVEISAAALAYTKKNLAPFDNVEIIAGDACDPRIVPKDLDMILTNPPYVPETPTLEPEVYADPPQAVFAGESGMEIINKLVTTIVSNLRPGGLIAIEHDDTTQDEVITLLATHGFENICGHLDAAAKPRFVTAKSKL
ncbi:peptide chain release factor N(5)-glutamine methyltransferase [Corynebacterium sp. ES2730-CONJ]|uniref:peptide chain release factor N(5)-glutamine methyltransferase n=1 Tax=Corynebacterium sp. ES2730-CONJ TaxID=2973941 RepID=UPI00216B3618|nr:peptide chain release factor N(5)-glutamine methyltransferase [Corynebacterium sp. ES2730-CONJ]MCS4531912.1 peptide chain release factor N(5)-glutamine methyltransferase [Corynebacterium sp. ES2730-CONJ]